MAGDRSKISPMTKPTDEENVDPRPDAEQPGDADVDATPRATTPIAPFGDAKPWAGSALSLDADADAGRAEPGIANDDPDRSQR